MAGVYTKNQFLLEMKTGVRKARKTRTIGKVRVTTLESCFLYKWPDINSRKRTTDTKELYTDVAADALLGPHGSSYFTDLGKSTRLDYNYNHDVVKAWISFNNADSTRKEEKFALQMYLASKVNKQPFGVLGHIFDYQVPLNEKKSDGYGKIDLVSENEKEVWLIELKHCHSTETLLRALLEIESYERILELSKFYTSYPVHRDKPIRKAILIGCNPSDSKPPKNTTILDDLMQLKKCSENMKKIQALLDLYKIEVFLINGHGKYAYPTSVGVQIWNFNEPEHIRCLSEQNNVGQSTLD
jgi:hypothetical protein